jgi:hypothetical protein
LLALLLNPKVWPWLATLAVAIFGVFQYAEIKTRDAEIASIKAASAQQVATDAAASAQAVAQLRDALDAANSAVADYKQKASNAPVTRSCGPALDDAERAARSLLNSH